MCLTSQPLSRSHSPQAIDNPGKYLELSIEEGPLSEVDHARANLICDLKKDIGVNEPGIDVILGLIDQIHGLRRALREAIEETKRGGKG